MSPGTVQWLALALGFVLLVGYELWLVRRAGVGAELTARSAHARLRAEWVEALAGRSGFEIVAVQTLRNSLMSATINASTAAIALMGAVTLGGPMLVGAGAARMSIRIGAREALEGVLMLVLFASFAASAMAMRYYNHAGYVLACPADSPLRHRWTATAADHLRRAGHLYSWGLRLFLVAGPIAMGIVQPLLMPVAMLALIVALAFFDRPVGRTLGED